MSKYKPSGKKQRLAKKRKQTKWAPFWTILKIYGKGRRVHPARHSTKRSWKRTKTKA